jgi:hypothetical protein
MPAPYKWQERPQGKNLLSGISAETGVLTIPGGLVRILLKFSGRDFVAE